MLKPEKKRKINFHLSPQAGTRDILKMYKYFPNLEYEQDGTLGCYITKVLMDSGYIWSKKTKDGVARGRPSRFSSRTWRLESQNFQSEEALRILWRGEGFKLPRNYWCGTGPKPSIKNTKKTIFATPPDTIYPGNFGISRDFLRKSDEQAQRLADLRASSKIKGLRRLEDGTNTEI